MLKNLTDLPNIGKAIAADLISIGIRAPNDLVGKDPLTVFKDLTVTMGHRHDPCVYYTLLSVEHYLKTEERLPWWNFTVEGRKTLDAKFRSR